MNNSHKTPKVGTARELQLKTHTVPLCYPFSAIVGQQEMKLALILNFIDRSVGGVLIMGHRGTGKSTVVRALADLLPRMSVVSGCRYGCDPAEETNFCHECSEVIMTGAKLGRQERAVSVVELPLGATEDRVCGTIDIEQALRSGVKRFEPGLLARANRGFLYIDEVNLLEDHLVDLLLDVSATGINNVEREGISVQHPARLVLIGSGNPEEGELRPQLLDRFGLYVEVKTEEDLDRRVEIVESREAFERNPESFRARFADEQEQLRKKITRARKSFTNVKIERRLLRDIAQLCSDLKVDGHRGELTITRAARALAAFEGRKKVTEADVRRVAVMSLRHRLRRDALEETASAERIDQALDRVFAGAAGAAPDDGSDGDDSSSGGGIDKRRRRTSKTSDQREPAATPNGNLSGSPNGNRGTDTATQPSSTPVETDLPKLRFDQNSRSDRSGTKLKQTSRQTGLKRTIYSGERGRYARSVTSRTISARLALDATLRAAAAAGLRVRPAVQKTNSSPDTRHEIPQSALRFKLFKRKQGRLFIFAIDLSGSMALNRIGHAKRMMHALLRESYIKRDSVAIVGFRGTTAELLLPPSRSILRARRVLDSVSVGGGTPLSAGLVCALELAKRVGPGAGEMFLLVFTDGQANVSLTTIATSDRLARERIIDSEIADLGLALKTAGVTAIVMSTQRAYIATAVPERLAEKLGARFESVAKLGPSEELERFLRQ